MSFVIVEDLKKRFLIPERRAGTLGALRGLFHRRYRAVDALAGVSFTIDRGELVGYIGPNGAGKSTTVKILSGILVPDSGRCEVGGIVPWEDREKHVARIGVVFGQRTQLWWDLPVIESFDLLRDIYRIDRRAYAATRDEMVALLEIGPILDTPVRQLSLGQRMRCDIAASFLHEPEILFLDEPTIGLDVIAKKAVRSVIRRINHDRRVTVILTTHDMDDIEAICDRVIIIGNGETLWDGPLGELRRRVDNRRHLVVDLDPSASAVRAVDLEKWSADASFELVENDGDRVRFSYDPDRRSSADAIAAVTGAFPVRDLFVEAPPIEDIIERIYATASDRRRGA